MRKNTTWLFIGIFVFLILFVGIVMKFNAHDTLEKLRQTAEDAKTLSFINHLLFLIVLIAGFAWAKGRNYLYPMFIVYLALSVSLNAFRYGIKPNMVIFPVLAILLVLAIVQGKFAFDFAKLPKRDLVFGGVALLFGFWYLELIESPIWLNALLYSPVGSVNCPTMLTISGILIWNTKRRILGLELLTAAATFTFGMLGLIRMDIYIDIILSVTSVYMVWRVWKSFNVSTEA